MRPRAAGDVSLGLPRQSSFLAGVRAPGSYWLAGSPSFSPELYYTSSARVVREVRAAFGLSQGSSYDRELLDRVGARWDSLRPSGATESQWQGDRATVLDAAREGEVIPLELFRLLVWYAFNRRDYREGPLSITFSREVGIPRVGGEIGTLEASIAVASVGPFNANAQEFNPFTGETPGANAEFYNPWCTIPPCDTTRVRGRRRDGDFGANTRRDGQLLFVVLGAAYLLGGNK